MEEDPLPSDALGKQRRILVLRRDDDPDPLDAVEVFGGREEHRRARVTVGGARDHVLPELFHPDGARVLEAPFLSVAPFERREQRLPVDLPPVNAVGRPGDGQMRDSRACLDAREQDGLAADLDRGGVEDHIHRDRPVRGREDRVGGMPPEELGERGGHAAVFTTWATRTTRGRPAASSTS